jgi:MFS transporter, DHA1 family, tetracycline resistance protein
LAGRARDAGRLPEVPGMAGGLAVAVAGLLVAAVVPGLVGIVVAAVAVGFGTGVVTPLGFAHLAGATPRERLGQTMGSAEVGRELGDAGGPLLVGVLAAAGSLGLGLTGLAVVLAALVVALLLPERETPTKPDA